MLNIISLGAGVQSSTMCLMSKHGELPMPDGAIFADTQHEPKFTITFNPKNGERINGGIYGWLDWLEKQLPFPIYRVSAGSLIEASLGIKASQKTPGNVYSQNLIPAYLLNEKGEKGLLGRHCTGTFKIEPINKKIKELLGIKRISKNQNIEVMVWIGISKDEAHRMKPSQTKFIQNIWPLIDKNMSRNDCLEWMRSHNYPTPPRSACTFCPFHGDQEWLKLKNNSPKDFAEAVKFEKDLQKSVSKTTTLKGSVPYLHNSCVSLDKVEFKKLPTHKQLDLFGNECEGMCGV